MTDYFGAYVYMIEPIISLFRVALIGIATGGISLFLTKSTLLNSFHDWLGKKSPFLEKLFSCPWCTSHWVGAFLLICYQPDILWGWHPGWMYSFAPLGFFVFLVDSLVTLMVIVFVAVIAAGIMYRSMNSMEGA